MFHYVVIPQKQVRGCGSEVARGSRPWMACEVKLCLQHNLEYTLVSAQSFTMRDDGAWMVIASHC